jgi:hypothetical protein
MTRRLGLFRAGLALGCLAGTWPALAACTPARSAKPPEQEPAPLVESVYLTEWLTLGATRCRVEEVERVLTEAQKPPKG